MEGGVKELQRLDDDVLGLPDLGEHILVLGLPDLVVLVLAPGDVDDGLLAVLVFAGLDLVMTIIKEIDCRQ